MLGMGKLYRRRVLWLANAVGRFGAAVLRWGRESHPVASGQIGTQQLQPAYANAKIKSGRQPRIRRD
ncbi:hypothetical protein [Tritonibacter horizontis]|uniref:Uncharacterized protein n=1 Tax=Tritonibacter horizontis TaxID=1768241 RepID=A0A132BVK8_9RHOB|nr:hypothetical protein [Tritonibacter horizontis]KUP92092.1 hypothetical protein TRIHO_31110 [Tritonibacter horizontis]